MSIAAAYHESLPYIDQEPSAESLAAARALIDADIAAHSSSSTSSPPPASMTISNFSPLFETELVRISSKTPLQPLDLSRYEAQEAPPPPPSPNPNPNPISNNLRHPLERAYVSSTYLAARAQNLHLLDHRNSSSSRNAWLLANHLLETDLAATEASLAAVRRDLDRVNAARAARQHHARPEIIALQLAWKTGVDRVLETEIAVEALRRRIRLELARQQEGEGAGEGEEQAIKL